MDFVYSFRVSRAEILQCQSPFNSIEIYEEKCESSLGLVEQAKKSGAKKKHSNGAEYVRQILCM